jgi:predicted metal-dependent hydrolase
VLRRLFSPAPKSKAADPAVLDVVVDGRSVPVTVRRNAAARRVTLRMRSAGGELVLTLPPRVGVEAARSFVERQTGWIAARLAALPQPIPFVDGAEIPLRGVPHTIVHRGPRGVTRVEPALRGGRPVLAVFGPPDHLARRVTDFLKREARRDLEPAAARHAAALGVTIARLTVKDTVSRWGSCSSAGALAFSWRLILAPPLVLDYLAAHEVAHRREMNHGARFWTLVHRLCPATDEAEAWLRRHGPGLHRYGASPKG